MAWWSGTAVAPSFAAPAVINRHQAIGRELHFFAYPTCISRQVPVGILP